MACAVACLPPYPSRCGGSLSVLALVRHPRKCVRSPARGAALPFLLVALPPVPFRPGIATQRAGNNQQGRTIGALNALTGQVNSLEGYSVGRQQVIQFYAQLNHTYLALDRLYVSQDHWNIHTHPDVLSALVEYPRITPVWLPTYAPWLNPIEKLWRWLRQDVLKMPRWGEDWPHVKQRVHDFLDQFAQGSSDLLRYVGLVGKSKLATVLNTS
jgi:hypothetical protein